MNKLTRDERAALCHHPDPDIRRREHHHVRDAGANGLPGHQSRITAVRDQIRPTAELANAELVEQNLSASSAAIDASNWRIDQFASCKNANWIEKINSNNTDLDDWPPPYRGVLSVGGSLESES